jgi:hypothetical protein
MDERPHVQGSWEDDQEEDGDRFAAHSFVGPALWRVAKDSKVLVVEGQDPSPSVETLPKGEAPKDGTL